MPYCPKCDMEFIDGITTCSDCGGPLVASKEAADAMKEEARRAAEAKAAKAYAEMMEEEAQEPLSDPGKAAAEKPQPRAVRPRIYVKKSQQYDDFKSSASAFYAIGAAALAFAALGWTGILPLPTTGLSRMLSLGVITLMGAGSLGVAISSSRSAKAISGQIREEEETTRQLTDWFITNYSGEQLDKQIFQDYGALSPEEQSLKRFDLIQDLIITNHDITDQAYVDLLSEEIYGKLYED